jgi:hypothetical protein
MTNLGRARTRPMKRFLALAAVTVATMFPLLAHAGDWKSYSNACYFYQEPNWFACELPDLETLYNANDNLVYLSFDRSNVANCYFELWSYDVWTGTFTDQIDFHVPNHFIGAPGWTNLWAFSPFSMSPVFADGGPVRANVYCSGDVPTQLDFRFGRYYPNEP